MSENSSQLPIEILISTMNQTSLSFLDAIFPQLNWTNLHILVINQTQENNFLNSDFPTVRVINSLEKGLSKSRNLAIQNSVGAILVIADDDVVFENDCIANIENAYFENPKAAMIAFCVMNEKGKLFKKYAKRKKLKLNFFDIYNIMSIEITLNKNNFDFKNTKFDENFGLGSRFPLGEEQIFLTDLKKQNSEMVFFPKVIASHDSSSSNEKIDFKTQYFILGSVYSRNHDKRYLKWIFLKLFFDVKQRKIKLTQVYSSLKSSLKGRSQFLKMVNTD